MAETGKTHRTSLHPIHLTLGARIIKFHGWELPVQYAGILQEHRCVRRDVGIFDLSHMGEFDVRGPGARAYLQRLITNNLDRIHDGKALYTTVCNARGGVLDDVLVYQRAADDYMVVVNAANIEKDFAWFEQHLTDDVQLVNRSYDLALIAVQGPRANEVVGAVVSQPTDHLYYYEFRSDEIAGVPITLARTGYTGEDGFEMCVENPGTQAVWEALWRAGEPAGMRPVGLAARDTLRLEMGYALYGNELSESITPIEAGLGWVVSAKKEFIGSEVVLPLKKRGATRTLRGLKLNGKRVPRQHCSVKAEGRRVGQVTSGTFSPTLNEPIALALIEATALDEALSVEIRGRDVPASLANLPFVPSHVRRRPKPNRGVAVNPTEARTGKEPWSFHRT